MRSVRSRLAVVLCLVAVLPGVAAAVAIGWLSPRQNNEAAVQLMRQASGALSGSLRSQCLAFGESARVLALQAGGDGLPGAVRSAVARQPGAFAYVVKDGAVLASAGVLPGVPAADLVGSSCSASGGPATGTTARTTTAGTTGLPVWLEVVPAQGSDGRSLGTAVVGTELDPAGLRAMVGALGLPPGTELAVICSAGRSASTVGGPVGRGLLTAAAEGPGSQVMDGYQVDVARVPAGQACAAAAGVARPGFSGQRVVVAAILLAWLVIGLLLVLGLSSGLTRPVLALTEAAERVARGDLSTRLPSARDDELGRLSGAFNVMTNELEQKIGELQRSRDLLRENVARLGDTLERTHDLEGLLGTVLGAATAATNSQRGTAWLVEGGSVVARATSPAGSPTSARRASVRRLAIGTDLAGEVAVDGLPRRLGHGHEDATTVLGGPALAAPLRRGPTTVGVLVVEREASRPAFDSDDEAMLVSLAGPAGIAVDNVLLHREAQRLSVTDPLTGAGNLRHMTTTLAREVERASRFQRPLSVLLLDLDHFKRVNDTYGHTVGDAVLRELARRLASCVREVDTVARYGGEEFVVVTPETDTTGAEHLAERICEAVRGEPFVVNDDHVLVTTSVGIASLPRHGTASGDLVRAADDGLYAAKRAGRDCWQVAADRSTSPVVTGEAGSDR
jgi:two-component system, cell cycle response regulator